MNQHAARTSENGVLLRPASLEEAGLFYSELDAEQDKALGTVGHIRMDFGHNGKEFWHTWWPHNEDQLNTPEFKDELQTIVDTLRTDGPLKDLTAMRSFCAQNGGAITRDGRSFGYVVETDHYRYCLRCTPSPGDYQGYLYCYDKQQQELAHQVKLVGRVTYADGTRQEFTDPQQYLRTIREELPYRNTTGFRYETLTESPQVKKAVDDIILGFAGEENPKRVCDYGLTEKGAQMLRDAADPSLPHTYAWFVLTDYNTAQEQLFCELTLEEAIQIYQNSDTLEKRLGVTKDSLATVDIVHMAGGDQRFFTDYQKLESFKTDPVIYEAVGRLHQELVQNSPAQNMSIRQITSAMEVEVAPVPGESMSLAEIEQRLNELNDRTRELVAEAARTKDPDTYATQLREIMNEVAKLKGKRAHIAEQRQNNAQAVRRIEDAVAAMEQASCHICEWDEALIRQLVDTVKVHSAEKITVYLRGGVQVDQDMI